MLSRHKIHVYELAHWARPRWMRRFCLPFIAAGVLLTFPVWLAVFAIQCAWEERRELLDMFGMLARLATWRVDYIERDGD